MQRFLIIALIIGAGFWYHQHRSLNAPAVSTQTAASPNAPWTEVSIIDFDSLVLKSSIPALVYFDAAEDCRGADVVFSRLRQRWAGRLAVFYFNAESNPEFARRYGVADNVVFALFDHGRVTKQIEAPDLLRPLMGPNHEVSSFEVFLDDFLAALERFLNLH